MFKFILGITLMSTILLSMMVGIATGMIPYFYAPMLFCFVWVPLSFVIGPMMDKVSYLRAVKKHKMVTQKNIPMIKWGRKYVPGPRKNQW